MELITIFFAALGISALTLYSGFGLGTLLLPAYAFFFSPELAVMVTAIVHFANNIFKVVIVGKNADKALVMAFGIPAIVAAFVGAAMLGYVAHFEELGRYTIAGQEAIVTPLKVIIATFMFFFALVELLPFIRAWKFDRKYLVLGGLLSGFFGGFSGHQGALRSAFLTKVDIEPAAFVGTNAVVGFMVDIARLLVYGVGIWTVGLTNLQTTQVSTLVLVGIAGALTGVLLGKRYLHKITMSLVQTITGIMLLGIAIALGMGLL